MLRKRLWVMSLATLTELQRCADGFQDIGEHCILLVLIVEHVELSIQLLVVITHQHGWACWVCIRLEVDHLQVKSACISSTSPFSCIIQGPMPWA